MDGLADDLCSDSVIKMGETIHLSKLERLIADGTICDSESGTSDDNQNERVSLLSDAKSHPDNKPFMIYPTDTDD